MRRASVFFILVFFATLPALCLSPRFSSCRNFGLFSIFGGKKQLPPNWALHNVKVDVGRLDLKGAEKPCGNWSWVASIANMAAARGVQIEQTYLVDRLYGGSVCLESAGNIAALAKDISHEYTLADGQRFTLAAQFTPGVPTQPDPLILSIRQDRPLMLLWRNRTFLLTGMSYDEYVAPSGNKMFIVNELRLFDPLGEEGKREVTFSRDHDNPDELGGLLELSIYTK